MSRKPVRKFPVVAPRFDTALLWLRNNSKGPEYLNYIDNPRRLEAVPYVIQVVGPPLGAELYYAMQRREDEGRLVVIRVETVDHPIPYAELIHLEETRGLTP